MDDAQNRRKRNLTHEIWPTSGSTSPPTRAPNESTHEGWFPCFQPFKNSPRNIPGRCPRKGPRVAVGVHLSWFHLFCSLTIEPPSLETPICSTPTLTLLPISDSHPQRLLDFRNENSARSFSDRSFFRGRPHGMSVPKCFIYQDLERMTEVFGGMSAGISGRKLPLWADFSFLRFRRCTWTV